MSVWICRRNDKILSLLATGTLIVHLAALLQYIRHKLTSKGRMAIMRYVQLATGTTVRGSKPRQRQPIFSPAKRRRERLWAPPSLLFNGQLRSKPGIKQPGREVHHSPAHSAGDKNEWSHTSTSPLRLHGVDSANFNFTVYFFSRKLCCKDL
jgi:hypothetical protein